MTEVKYSLYDQLQPYAYASNPDSVLRLKAREALTALANSSKADQVDLRAKVLSTAYDVLCECRRVKEKSIDRPSRPKMPVILVSFTDKSDPVSAKVEAVYKDAADYLWKTEDFPCFWFDMEFVGKSEALAVATENK